jgi:hypothetical protein
VRNAGFSHYPTLEKEIREPLAYLATNLRRRQFRILVRHFFLH